MDESKLSAVFAEWDRRYREHPDEFMNEVEHLLGGTSLDYGMACAAYFLKLYNEMFPTEKRRG